VLSHSTEYKCHVSPCALSVIHYSKRYMKEIKQHLKPEMSVWQGSYFFSCSDIVRSDAQDGREAFLPRLLCIGLHSVSQLRGLQRPLQLRRQLLLLESGQGGQLRLVLGEYAMVHTKDCFLLWFHSHVLTCTKPSVCSTKPAKELESNIPPITFYWTVPRILDHSYFVGNLTNSKISETKA
jgi:hypothetical protein